MKEQAEWTDKLVVVKDGAIGRVTLNQPQKRNAMNFGMWRDLGSVIAHLEQDVQTRVIVISGAGDKAFSAGADISEFAELRSTPEQQEHYDRISAASLAALRKASKIVIAMIDGYCVGGGAELAMCCDILIASERSSFGIPPAKLGIGYPFADIEHMVHILGPLRTVEILATGRLYTAAEALAMGWVNHVTPASELVGFVDEFAGTIADNAPLTVRAVKGLVAEALKPESERDYVLCERLVRDCNRSHDYVEGQRAFVEKRKPRFKGV